MCLGVSIAPILLCEFNVGNFKTDDAWFALSCLLSRQNVMTLVAGGGKPVSVYNLDIALQKG